jgi:hypothetical protein
MHVGLRPFITINAFHIHIEMVTKLVPASCDAYMTHVAVTYRTVVDQYQSRTGIARQCSPADAVAWTIRGRSVFTHQPGGLLFSLPSRF